MPKTVILYSSIASGFITTKKYTTMLENLFNAKKVPFEFVDISIDTQRQAEMFAISAVKTLPQVHVDGKYIGGWEQIEDLNETDQFDGVFK